MALSESTIGWLIIGAGLLFIFWLNGWKSPILEAWKSLLGSDDKKENSDMEEPKKN